MSPINTVSGTVSLSVLSIKRCSFQCLAVVYPIPRQSRLILRDLPDTFDDSIWVSFQCWFIAYVEEYCVEVFIEFSRRLEANWLRLFSALNNTHGRLFRKRITEVDFFRNLWWRSLKILDEILALAFFDRRGGFWADRDDPVESKINLNINKLPL